MNYNSELAENFRRERNKWLKKYFSNSGVKINFVIAILRTIDKEQGINYFKWFKLPFDVDKMVTWDYDNPDYIICKHIIGAYKSFTLFKPMEERKELENSDCFKRTLIEEVVFRLNISMYSKDMFRKKQLRDGHSFIYFSIPYYMFTICVYLLTKIDQKSMYAGLRLNILQSAFAILDLMENNIIDTAYPICRGLIETYVKYLCLIGKFDALKMRDELVDEEISHNVCGNDYSKNFEKMFDSKQGFTNNKLHFLHYGFVDKINDYYKVVDKNNSPYSITSMFRYLKETVQWGKKEEVEALERYYYICHTYVHGNCFNKYLLNGYFELSDILYMIIIDIFKSVCNELKEGYTIEGMDVMKHVELAYKQLEYQKENKSTELLDEYYKESM